MIGALLNYLNNHFIDSWNSGTTDGYVLTVPRHKLLVGQYVQIHASKLNDGTYKIVEIDGDDLRLDETLTPENIKFVVYGLAIPKDVILLAEEIKESEAREVKQESLGDWSATYKGWQEQFAMRLKTHRRVYSDLRYQFVKHEL
jgi:hypothetical protein